MSILGLTEIKRELTKVFGKLSDREKEIAEEFFEIITDGKNHDETFEIFWDKFHNHINKPRTGKEGARKAWKKTTKTNKYKATMRIELYAKQKPKHEHEYLRMAKYYLSEKLYLEELVPVGNTDSKEHADRLYNYTRDNTEWIDEIGEFYGLSNNDVLTIAQRFINRCWLSGTLPTDLGKYKINLIQFIDKKYEKSNKGPTRISNYQRLLAGMAESD